MCKYYRAPASALWAKSHPGWRCCGNPGPGALGAAPPARPVGTRGVREWGREALGRPLAMSLFPDVLAALPPAKPAPGRRISPAWLLPTAGHGGQGGSSPSPSTGRPTCPPQLCWKLVQPPPLGREVWRWQSHQGCHGLEPPPWRSRRARCGAGLCPLAHGRASPGGSTGGSWALWGSGAALGAGTHTHVPAPERDVELGQLCTSCHAHGPEQAGVAGGRERSPTQKTHRHR